MVSGEEARRWIFRDCRQEVLLFASVERLGRLLAGPAPASDHLMDALLAAGELECALADDDDPASGAAAQLTDAVARALVPPCVWQPGSALAALQRIRTTLKTTTASASPPEGFAYYALHPLQFEPNLQDCNSRYAVVGIRSIGTVLSAVSAASIAHRGKAVSRITVRPRGDPYNRTVNLTPEQLRWVHGEIEKGSVFFVVDEGPGLSGSSFLSVAEALEKAGVGTQRITMVGTREPEAAALYATRAAERWPRFRWQCTSGSGYDEHLGLPWGGGQWRASIYDSQVDWPATWPQMERLKFFDGGCLLKFDGLGRFGQAVRDRATQLYDSGFGPRYENAGEGLSAYQWLPGKPLTRREASSPILELMAQYCALRAGAFHARPSGNSVYEMAVFNCRQELGFEPRLNRESLAPKTAIVVDGRMQPHEWIWTPSGRIFKVDGSTHGDDHFFPGPTDIAWDLAGAILEWDLTPEQAGFLLSRYKKMSGDDATSRIESFSIAYAAFRLAYTGMAYLATADPHERRRLQSSENLYRTRLQALAHTSPNGCKR